VTKRFKSVARRSSHRVRRSHGAVLVAALVAMLVAMSLLAAMLQGTLRAKRQLRAERDLRQTELLVEAGLGRAAWRLSHDGEYRGETWNVPAGEFASRDDAQIIITVKPAAAGQSKQVDIVARYPADGPLSIQRTRTFSVQITQSSL